jgi:hypothetical protein
VFAVFTGEDWAADGLGTLDPKVMAEDMGGPFAAASSLSAIEIQQIAQTGSVVNVAPNTATPSSMPRKAWSCALLRSHNLQSPENHREILADTKLRKIFGKVKVTMFEMNKHLAQHVK